jgi:hypothetical protein
MVSSARAPVLSEMTHCTLVRQLPGVEAPTLMVNLPGSVFDVDDEPFGNPMRGSGQMIEYGRIPSNTSTSLVPDPQMVSSTPVRLMVSGIRVSVPVAVEC